MLASLVWAGGVAACAGAPPPAATAEGPRVHAIHVVSNGWHTAIVVPRDKLRATDLLPEVRDFPEAAFLEFGWGDRVYYPAGEKTLGMTLNAALTPTPSVMHVAGRARAPVPDVAGREVVRLKLTEAGFRQLIAAIAGTFERPEDSRAEPVSAGLYPDSHFYHARGSFHLFNTCNTWTARMLRAGGVRVTPGGVITASDLMTQFLGAAARTPRTDAGPSPGRRAANAYCCAP